jgi:putative two-component system response regulator
MSKATILVIDDETSFLTIMEDFLEGHGYSVLKAASGADGYQIARSRRPDLIILDISMPLMDGGEVAQKLRETSETKDIPVIFLTGLLSKEIEANKGHIIGGHIMFSKPCNFGELVEQIERLVCVRS